ncbi:4Fe-4S binding protein [uncultured Clostridium sp.]|uniref:4Fe-4S binding protein n=1 Tax=uncultured Clostridium sp. TaxID=59620 RepID=UPI00262AED9C|nr:4Fe-4S binding protein [uncultured Clostridium sp.]
MKKTKKKWYEYLWIATIIYFTLGLFNILFAWLGLLCFSIPLIISFTKKNKAYCNSYRGRGQLLENLGRKFSRNKPMPKFLKTKVFRYGFLIFFLIMFVNMIYITKLVFAGENELKEVLTLMWTFKVPWKIVDLSNVTPWIAQFAFGFYSMMITSTILGVVTMVLYKPKSWCVYCPMGTMTQGICLIKSKL